MSDVYCPYGQNDFDYLSLLYGNDILTGLLGSFTWGLILSPLSAGLAYLIVSTIIWEAVVFYASTNWSPGIRVLSIAIAFLGFYIGRLIIGDDEPLRLQYGLDEDKRYFKK